MSHPKGQSTGEWRPDQRVVEIRQQRGKHWSTHGHSHKGTTVVLPEEALFLMECGALEILHESKPFNLQEAYHTLLLQSALQLYQVFASLKRIGFIAHRVYLLWPPAPSATSDTPLTTHSSCPLCAVAHSNSTHPHSSDTRSHSSDAHPHSSDGSDCGANNRLVLLEVYKPSGSRTTPYRKSDPGPPDFRVMVVRPGEQFPSAATVKALCSIQPSCPFRVCVVEGASLTYFTLTLASKHLQPVRTTQHTDN